MNVLQNKLNFHHNVTFRINPDTRNRFGSVIPEVSIPGVRVAPGLQIQRVVCGATDELVAISKIQKNLGVAYSQDVL